MGRTVLSPRRQAMTGSGSSLHCIYRPEVGANKFSSTKPFDCTVTSVYIRATNDMRMVLAFLAATVGAPVFAADYAQAGALAKDGNWEVSFVYGTNVNVGSAVSPANYLLPAGAELLDLRNQSLDNSVILSIAG